MVKYRYVKYRSMTASVVNGKKIKIQIKEWKGEIRKMQKLKEEEVEKVQNNKITQKLKEERGITLLAQNKMINME